ATNGEPAALRLFFPLSYDRALDDYTASASVKTNLANRSQQLARATALVLNGRASEDIKNIHLTLVESDGTSWSHTATLSTNWTDVRIPLDQLKIGAGVKLPLGFPGRWNYWLYPPKGR